MEIIKTLIVKTKKNKYAFDLTKNTYSFWYEHAHAETKGQFYVYENNGKIIISEKTDYVNFYINNTKFVSFTKDAWHDFESLEQNYRNVIVMRESNYLQNKLPCDAFAIFRADDFSISLSNELTFIKTNNVYYNTLIFECVHACDFGVQDSQSNNLYNIIEVARKIAVEKPVIYRCNKENWVLTLSDKGKGLLSKYKFVNS